MKRAVISHTFDTAFDALVKAAEDGTAKYIRDVRAFGRAVNVVFVVPKDCRGVISAPPTQRYAVLAAKLQKRKVNYHVGK